MLELMRDPEARGILKAVAKGIRDGRITVFNVKLEPDGVRRVHVGFDTPDYYVVRGGGDVIVIEFYYEPVPGAKKVLKRGRSYSKVSIPAELVKGREGPVLGEIEYDSKGRKRRIILYLG